VRSEALAWAGVALGTEVSDVVELAGGTTSTMLSLVDSTGRRSILRLMTQEPWRSHGAALTRREHAAFTALAGTPVPAPQSLALDADGTAAGVAAHLMTRLPGRPASDVGDASLTTMAALLAQIHTVRPDAPFRAFESWAWEAKWQVPAWSRHPGSWRAAFELLAGAAPAYLPTFPALRLQPPQPALGRSDRHRSRRPGRDLDGSAVARRLASRGRAAAVPGRLGSGHG
jgi:aminoglycoside phosphotransferase (APT) family kinase protein